MSKITTVLAMIIGSVFYQMFLTSTPDYMESAQMAYWASITTLTLWLQEKAGDL